MLRKIEGKDQSEIICINRSEEVMLRKSIIPFIVLITFLVLFLTFGCSSHSPTIKMPNKWPDIVKFYDYVYVKASSPNLAKTSIYLREGDFYSIVTRGKVKTNNKRSAYTWNTYGSGLSTYIDGKYSSWTHYNTFSKSKRSGKLAFIIRDGPFNQDTGRATNPSLYMNNRGGYAIDIIVWEKEDYGVISKFLEQMYGKNPEIKELEHLLALSKRYNNIDIAKDETKKQVEETKQKIIDLKVGETSTNQESTASASNQKIAELEAQLEKLMVTLTQLDLMKDQLADEKKKSDLLTQKLEEREQREKELLNRISQTNKLPPVLVIASPRPHQKTESKYITFSGVIEDDQGIQKVDVFLNNKSLALKSQRGIIQVEKSFPKRVDFNQRVLLSNGVNKIRISAIDKDGLSTTRVLVLHKIKKRSNVWAVIIGINKYPNVPALKYAVNDAKAFYQLLVDDNQVPEQNVTLLLDDEASLGQLRSILGTVLKRKADKEDMVIIYFAGHGATERDAMSLDGDGLEKYILPYNARMNDLYASAIPMREISHIFNRIQSERLIFIADACYSGASGGRTVGAPGFRTNISDSFLDRISKGKGRVIITASATNEVSVEDDNLRHGVFTYYLIEGLRGSADIDQDGLITVDEAYRYVSSKVKKATGQRQHPLKKGTVEGRLVLGISK